jgi:hypothetical protein
MSRKTRNAKRIAAFAAPELSDEAACMMQFFLEDFYLWFSSAYGDQIRRYYQPWRHDPGQPRHNIDDPF